MKTLALSAILTLTAYAQTANPLHEAFRKDYRASAIALVAAHLERHRKCDLADVLPTLERMQLFFPPEMPSNRHAQAFPSVGHTQPNVFINADVEWNERRAVLTLIHESTHVTRRKGRWLCGPDRETPNNRRYLRDNPPCRLFGKTQYNTDDISRDLEEHLQVELSKLENRNNNGGFMKEAIDAIYIDDEPAITRREAAMVRVLPPRFHAEGELDMLDLVAVATAQTRKPMALEFVMPPALVDALNKIPAMVEEMDAIGQ